MLPVILLADPDTLSDTLSNTLFFTSTLSDTLADTILVNFDICLILFGYFFETLFIV